MARLDGVALDKAVRRRSRFMQPWDSVPKSLAHGILDDETYDWFEVVKAMRETGGEAVVVDETAIERALELVRAHTAIPASATGAAGLAGALAAPARGAAAAVLSGIERGGADEGGLANFASFGVARPHPAGFARHLLPKGEGIYGVLLATPLPQGEGGGRRPPGEGSLAPTDLVCR